MENLLWAAISLVILLFSAVVHEIAHGWVAYRLGDPTAYYQGRLTLNPIKHIDPFMTIILPVALLLFSNGRFAFGGAKPVPINPYNFRHPDKGLMLSSLAGPLSNILLAVLGTGFFFLFAVIIKHTHLNNPQLMFFFMQVIVLIIIINMMLAVFNLVPIPPLDGSRIMRYFLPWDMKESLDRLEPFGFIIIMLLLSSGAFVFLDIVQIQVANFLELILTIV